MTRWTRAVAASLSLAAGAAFACSDAGTIETECPIRPYDGARVPANLPALAFGVFSALDAGAFELRGPDGGVVPLTLELQVAPILTYLARPLGPLEANATYVATVPCARADGGVRSVQFETTAAVTLPSTVGTLTALAPQPNPMVGTLCEFPKLPGVEAQLEFVPSAELAAFMPVAQLTLRASTLTGPWVTWGYGNDFHSVDPLRHAIDRVYTVCSGSGNGLPQGTTTLELQATIAGSTAVFTPTTTTVTLLCDGGVPSDAGTVDPPDAGATEDAGMFEPDASVDGGTFDAGTRDAGTDGGTMPSPENTGCGCSSDGGSGALLFALLLVIALSRRTISGSPSGRGSVRVK